MVPLLHRLGFRSWLFQGWAMLTVGVCIALWLRAKGVDQEERGNAERRALFAGLWVPSLWGVGSSLQRYEESALRRGRRLLG